MAKSKTKKAEKLLSTNLDGSYLLKIVVYTVLGFQWVRLVDAGLTKQIPIPVGLLLGIIFATRDHFKIDRKIEYAILLISALVGFWVQAGVSLAILR
jgi:hypothetical protein